MVTAEAVQEIVAAITPFIGENMARSATRVHCEKLGIAEPHVTPQQVDMLIARLETGLRVFMGRDKATLPDAAAAGEARRRGMSRAIDRLLWPLLSAATLLFVGWGVVPRAARLHHGALAPRLIAVAAIVKLTLLGLGALWSWRRARIDRCRQSRPSRPGPSWPCGLLCNVIGQAALARYQLVGQQSPFPSAGDVFYLLAYPLVGAALVRFVSAYHEAGYPMGSRAERVGLLAVTATVCAGLSFVGAPPGGPGRDASAGEGAQRRLSPPGHGAARSARPPPPHHLALPGRQRGHGLDAGPDRLRVHVRGRRPLRVFHRARPRPGSTRSSTAPTSSSYGLIAGGVRKHLAPRRELRPAQAPAGGGAPSIGKPASRQPRKPPASGRTRAIPRRRSRSATRALVASLGQVQ